MPTHFANMPREICDCGAEYEIHRKAATVAQNGSVECAFCGKLLLRWQRSPVQFRAELVKSPPAVGRDKLN